MIGLRKINTSRTKVLGKSSTCDGVNVRRLCGGDMHFDMGEARGSAPSILRRHETTAQAFLKIWGNPVSHNRLSSCWQRLYQGVGLWTTCLPDILDMRSMGTLTSIGHIGRKAAQLSRYRIKVIAPFGIDADQIKRLSALIT
jgi:hypothetical protein